MYSGQIHLILGPMFSGKTSEMIRRIRRHTIAKKKCVVIKYSKDTRYNQKEEKEEKVYTHDLVSYKAVSCEKLCQISKDLLGNGNGNGDVDVIGIDEGQFFSDLVSFCEYHANKGKLVIVAGLDGTYQRKPFETIINLLPLSETVIKLNAVCIECRGDASFSKRIGNEIQLEVIGGADKYSAVCRKCFFSSE